jgi:hypothetical protein
MNLDLP